MIVRDLGPITLAGGAYFPEKYLKRALNLAPTLIAADGGADSALELGLIPKAVIGDFDSLSSDSRQKIPAEHLHEIAEQDTTDFDKCLRNIQAPLIIGVGFSGGRLDHHLAAFNALVRHAHQRCILVGPDELVFLVPPSLSLTLKPECPVSLFPMGAVEGVSDGLRWPIAGLNFAPDGRVGTSNHATGPVHLSLTAPKMLMITPLDTLEVVAEALLSTHTNWSDP